MKVKKLGVLLLLLSLLTQPSITHAKSGVDVVCSRRDKQETILKVMNYSGSLVDQEITLKKGDRTKKVQVFALNTGTNYVLLHDFIPISNMVKSSRRVPSCYDEPTSIESESFIVGNMERIYLDTSTTYDVFAVVTNNGVFKNYYSAQEYNDLAKIRIPYKPGYKKKICYHPTIEYDWK